MTDLDYAQSFDRSTVRQCRAYDEAFREMAQEIPTDETDREKMLCDLQRLRNFFMWHLTGEQAEAKIVYVREMKERDRRREDLLESTRPRLDVRCLKCSSYMGFLNKELYSGLDDRDRVLIMYECPKKCLPRRAFYDDGEEFARKGPTCVRCGKPATDKADRSGGYLVIISTCADCGHIETMDFSPSVKDGKGDAVDEYYDRDRAEYCLDEKGLQSYREGKSNLEHFKKLMGEIKAREADTKTNERMASLRRLRAIELKEVVTKALEDIGMTSVTLSDPVQGMGLRIKISMLDSDPKRSDWESEKAVRTAVEQALHDTNWRLVKTSLSSTLGALNGELRGYVSDEEVRKLIEQENKANESQKSS